MLTNEKLNIGFDPQNAKRPIEKIYYYILLSYQLVQNLQYFWSVFTLEEFEYFLEYLQLYKLQNSQRCCANTTLKSMVHSGLG
jgi:hypothetical protein